MRRHLPLDVLVLVLVSCFGCGRAEVERQLAETERMREAYERRIGRYKAAAIAKDEYIKSVTVMLNKITDRIELLRSEELNLMSFAVIGEAQEELTDHRVPETLERVHRILNENRAQIESLEGILANTEHSLVEFVEMTHRLRTENDALEQRISLQHKRIAALSGRVEELETEVVNLASDNTDKEALLVDREAEINDQRRKLAENDLRLRRVFYLVGSVRDLRKEGIMNGRKRLGADVFADPQRFQGADRTALHEIDLGAERHGLRVLPPRREGSYRFEVRHDRTWLVILDREVFWRIQFVVIAYKR